MAENLNKDGLVPGQDVSLSEAHRINAARRKKPVAKPNPVKKSDAEAE